MRFTIIKWLCIRSVLYPPIKEIICFTSIQRLCFWSVLPPPMKVHIRFGDHLRLLLFFNFSPRKFGNIESELWNNIWKSSKNPNCLACITGLKLTLVSLRDVLCEKDWETCSPTHATFHNYIFCRTSKLRKYFLISAHNRGSFWCRRKRHTATVKIWKCESMPRPRKQNN